MIYRENIQKLTNKSVEILFKIDVDKNGRKRLKFLK